MYFLHSYDISPLSSYNTTHIFPQLALKIKSILTTNDLNDKCEVPFPLDIKYKAFDLFYLSIFKECIENKAYFLLNNIIIQLWPEIIKW